MRAFATLAMCAATTVGADMIPTWVPQPQWCNGSLPLHGFVQLAGVQNVQVFHSAPDVWTYNHAAMMGWDGARLLLTWKNGVENEDRPGQRIMVSQSDDGVEWTPADGRNILFPNMSTSETVNVALFAEPPVLVNGRVYAAATPRQFCVYPFQYWASGLLLRRVYTDAPGHFGPLFWANTSIPAGLDLASALNNVSTLNQMDEQTQTDIALLNTAGDYGDSFMPCGDVNASAKCEACAGGCQDWSLVPATMSNERTHYTLPPADGRTGYPDVLLYRSTNSTLFASVRTGAGEAWSPLAQTNIPNQPSNINAGFVPDGRRFLVWNPCGSRDPLVVATSRDGLTWDRAASLVSCVQLAPDGSACEPRWPGNKSSGVAYPQAVVLGDAEAVPPSLRNSMWVAWTNNKEDVWVSRVPLASLP